MVAQVGYSVLERPRGWVSPCAVCTGHMEMRRAGFLVECQNQGQRFVSGLISKPLGRFSPAWHLANPHDKLSAFVLYPSLGFSSTYS
jgi:hypothetical protein